MLFILKQYLNVKDIILVQIHTSKLKNGAN